MSSMLPNVEFGPTRLGVGFSMIWRIADPRHTSRWSSALVWQFRASLCNRARIRRLAGQTDIRTHFYANDAHVSSVKEFQKHLQIIRTLKARVVSAKAFLLGNACRLDKIPASYVLELRYRKRPATSWGEAKTRTRQHYDLSFDIKPPPARP